MNRSMFLALVIGIALLAVPGCGGGRAEPTPNLNATVEGRSKGSETSQPTPTQVTIVNDVNPTYGLERTMTPSPTNTPVPTLTPTATTFPTTASMPTPAPASTPTPTPTPVPVPTVTIAFEPTAAPTPVPVPTVTIAFEPTAAPTPVPVPTVTIAFEPTAAPTPTPPPTSTSIPNAASVTVKSFAFSPMSVTVEVSGTVTWDFTQGTHTTTGSGSESWDSEFKNSGSFSHRFERPGTFSYICSLHPSMTGTVIVE